MSIFKSLTHTFPVQLLFHHLKNHLLLLLPWFMFVAAITGGIGRVYGIHYLFLDPEYLNEVGFLSFFIVGLSFGVFVMAYQITSYVLCGHMFSFLGILQRPYYKYTINNAMIPLFGLVLYVVTIAIFQYRNQLGFFETVISIVAVLAGVVTQLLIMTSYFRFTNHDIFKYMSGSVDRRLKRNVIGRMTAMDRLKMVKKVKPQVKFYLDQRLRWRNCTGLGDFPDKASIIRVFDQNHFNSVMFELLIVVAVLVLGFFIERPVVQIPAAASVLLLFSILIMLIGAVSYWFRSWGVAIVIALFIAANYSSTLGITDGINQAGGLNYAKAPVEYSREILEQQRNKRIIEADISIQNQSLNGWLERQDSLPKMVLVCVSGGGQRAAVWVVNVLQTIDKKLSESIMAQTAIITGASGGMIGASYYRELYRQLQSGEKIDLQSAEWPERMGRDNLNSIIFSLVVNDAFFKLGRYKANGMTYKMDRGYLFEKNMEYNLNGVLNRPLSDYSQLVNQGAIPRMIFSPIIANDGRKLYVSSSPVSYMMKNEASDIKIRGIDFQRLFADHGADQINFQTVLRMSASFPYITPTISLPSEPRMDVMDAGISDNFGISDGLQFTYVFKDWIETNTSGVVMVVIRDTRKLAPIEPRSNPSIIDRFTNPIANVYNNLSNMQDIVNDNQLKAARDWLGVPLEMISFEYDTYSSFDQVNYSFDSKRTLRTEIERASLSWHLTEAEKKNIKENIDAPHNRKALVRLHQLIDQ
ncbi:MAG: patatin-like phospholipase family protein [Cyclobacteriaceae bacterium]